MEKKQIIQVGGRNAFKSFSVLKATQVNVKEQLGDNYEELVKPFVTIVEMTMKANGINEFDAMKKIKEETELYKKTDAPAFFACAVVEITESKHFVGFRN